MAKKISNEELKARICPICGGRIDVDVEESMATCEYCGTLYDVPVSDSVKKEFIKSKTYKSIEEEKIKQYKETAEKREKENRLAEFKSGKMVKIAAVFTVISVVYAFNSFTNSCVISGILAAIQAVVFVGAILMGMQVINERVRNLHIVLILIGLLLIIPIYKIHAYEVNIAEEKAEQEYDKQQEEERKKEAEETEKAKKPTDSIWKEAALEDFLPIPESKKALLVDNDSEYRNVYVYDITGSEYKDYLEKCKAKGFTEDERYDKYSESTIVFNKDGYKLDIEHDDSSKEMHFDLYEPLKLEKLEWPNAGFSKKIPEPDSDLGSIEQDETGDIGAGFKAYVGKMPMNKYKQYVSECIEAGFDVDYDRDKYHFTAKDKDKYDIEIEYYGNDIIYISIDNTWVDDDDDSGDGFWD